MTAIRAIDPDDVDFLWEMLFWAAHVDEDVGVTRDDIRLDPDLVGHVTDWGRDGDVGVIAEQNGRTVGAAWLRLFVPGVSDFSVYVDDLTPELVIAVDPGLAGRGIGSLLLTALFDRADSLHPATVLSVRSTNPACRLYERFGYREVDRVTNRVGSQSIRMVRRSRREGIDAVTRDRPDPG